MNTPTLDTAAIRARFDGAVIGIRADGTMAVLIETTNIQLPMYPTLSDGVGKPVWCNIVDGRTHTLDEFPTLIRPGDECEGRDSMGKIMGIYCGFSGDVALPHCIRTKDNMVYHLQTIRPLPAPAVEQTREQKAVELVKELAAFGRKSYPISMESFIRRAAVLFGEEGERG